jgi:hypothetical protein
MGSMSLWAVIVIISFFNMFPSVVQLALGNFVFEGAKDVKVVEEALKDADVPEDEEEL